MAPLSKQKMSLVAAGIVSSYLPCCQLGLWTSVKHVVKWSTADVASSTII